MLSICVLGIIGLVTWIKVEQYNAEKFNEYLKQKPKYTFKQCQNAGGKVLNRFGSRFKKDRVLGEITDLLCQCVCYKE